MFENLVPDSQKSEYNIGQENVQEQENDNSYTFHSGSVDDYAELVNELKKPKQEYDPPSPDEIDEIANSIENPDKGGGGGKISEMASEGVAKFVVNNIDRIFSFILDLIAQNDDDDIDFSADADEKAELLEAWKLLFPDPSKKLPPWAMVTISTFMIYGLKGRNAWQLRKQKQELESERAKISEQRKEIEDLQKRLDIQNNG
jgi:hypothetical protein